MEGFPRLSLAWALAAVGIASFVAGAGSPTPAKAASSVLQGARVELGTNGWRAHHATLQILRDTSAGRATEVVYSGRRTRGRYSFAIYRWPRPVVSSAGTVYRAAARVRSSSRSRLCVRVRELSGSRVVGQATRCILVTRSWRTVRPAQYKARRNGTRLGLSVFQQGARPGARFAVTDPVLESRPPEPTATVTAPPPALGVHFHALWNSYSGPERLQVLDKLAAAGSGWIRVDLMWSYTEIAPGVFNPGTVQGVDFILDEAAKRSLKVLVVTFGTPGWANGGQGPAVPPSDPGAFGRYAARLGEMFGNRVAAWQVWNEPNWRGFWTGSAAQYVALLREGYGAFKSSSPNSAVVFGGLASNDVNWLRDAYAAGAADAYDVMATHPYPSPSDGPPETDATLARTAAIRELMNASGDGDKPVWFTELGWSSHADTGGEEAWERGVSDQEQADYLVRAVAVVRSRFPFVRALFWYNERNRTDSSQVENNFGLLTHDLVEKPVYAAFKALNAEFGSR